MKKQLMIPFSLLAAVLIFTLLSLTGCEPLDIQGTPITNLTARIYWAGVPSDSMVHSFNPMLHWFGNDEDGQINDYIYGVFQGAYMDSASRETSLDIPDTLTWISLGDVTEAVFPLVASPDSSDTIGQYLVLRGIDDSGDMSNVINRYLYRTNNRPTCIITVPEGPQWVLPDTTSTWHGINVSWEGGDSLDYTTFQPDFIWEVRIYGPYDTVVVDTISGAPDDPDTSENMLVRYLTDDDDDSLRIAGTSASLIDLRTGYYIIYVRNFDDANVSSVPTMGIIEVFEPHWIPHPEEVKDILFLNATGYNPVPGNLGSDWEDSVQQFYSEMISSAGILSEKWDWTDETPDINDLYMYRLVIISDIDWNADINANMQEPFVEYMDVGGKLWVIGRYSFYNTSTTPGLYEYQGNAVEPLPFTYFGLEGAFYPPSNFFDAEFVGANVIDNVAGLPQLRIDTLKVQALNSLGDPFQAFPKVEYLLRTASTQSLYTFNSISPDSTGSFHGFPVAVQLETSTFKSSYFTFPLFFIEYDSSVEVFDIMLSWFLDE